MVDFALKRKDEFLLGDLPPLEKDYAWKMLKKPKSWGVKDASERIDEFLYGGRQLAIFIGTGIFVATRNTDNENHKRAAELISDALQGKFGAVYTYDYILDEAVTIVLIITRRRDLAVDIGRLILESPRLEKIMTSMDQLYDALEKFQKFTHKTFSFTDCINLIIIERNGIDYIMSFNSDFDGIVPRIS